MQSPRCNCSIRTLTAIAAAGTRADTARARSRLNWASRRAPPTASSTASLASDGTATANTEASAASSAASTSLSSARCRATSASPVQGSSPGSSSPSNSCPSCGNTPSLSGWRTTFRQSAGVMRPVAANSSTSEIAFARSSGIPAANHISRALRVMYLSSSPLRALLSPVRRWPATPALWSKDLQVATTSSSNCCNVLEMLPGSYSWVRANAACSKST